MTSENAIPIAIIRAGRSANAGAAVSSFRKCPREFTGSPLPVPATSPLGACPTPEDE